MKRVCVFCGSSHGARPIYTEVAVRLGKALASRDLTLVYGGATRGLMGVIADTVLANGGEVVGVIPDFMVSREIAHERLTELHVVHSMHERKRLMMELADAFVTLPGGFGTLDELSDVATWSQLQLHRCPKRCGLVNVDGFFDPLLAYLDRAVEEGFLKPVHRLLIVDEPEPEALIDRLQAPFPEPVVEKW